MNATWVVCPADCRVTMKVTVWAPPSGIVVPVPTTVGPDKPPKYPTTWYTDYMVWYQKRNYDAVYPQAAE